MAATPAGTAPTTHWDAAAYQANAAFVPTLGLPLLDLLRPLPGEDILDLGCGDGALTERLVAAGANVTGVDSSPEMIAAAKARGLKAEVVDGHRLNFDRQFDAVLSNAALHWMRQDPAAVVAGVFRALRPGGRFVAEMGGAGNVATILAALGDAFERRGVPRDQANPWFFPTEDQYRALLAGAGFEIRELGSFARPTPLPTGLPGWLATFAKGIVAPFAPQIQSEILAEAAAAAGPSLSTADGWSADYVRLRFVVQKPL